ncbi:MAG TPA: tryptophan--tRNA ligase [Acidimicrobiales bacterium]|nr:tryptophan--tRNA ligase [Acidimicrobiales bacterium]
MRVFSGIQPSGAMHLGNYLGAVKQWVQLQDTDSFYCVVDLHALTLELEPSALREQTTDAVATVLAAGLDPELCTLFLQSRVPYHAQMSWLLECVTTFGELNRMTQFKEKAGRQKGYRVGLFTYPVLMASDILLYNTEQVPVGDDQRQHLELTREVAERFNNRYGDTFTIPEGVQPRAGARIMDLQEPTRKMSKSIASPLGTVYLLDDPADIERKIKRAVTDTDGEVRLDWELKPGVSNLLEIYSSFTGETSEAVAAKYERYGDLKSDLAALVIEALSPISARYRELRSDPGELQRIVERGAAKADTVARPVYERAATAVGLY